VIEEAFGELVAVMPVKRACRLLGKFRASHYRRLKPKRPKVSGPVVRRVPSNALTPAEREQVVTVLHSDRFADNDRPWCFRVDLSAVPMGWASRCGRRRGRCGVGAARSRVGSRGMRAGRCR